MKWKFWQRGDDTIGPDPTEAHTLGDGSGSGFSVASASSSLAKSALSIAGVYLTVAALVGIWWSFEPDRIDIDQPISETPAANVTGYKTTATTIEVARTLLHKPGGYLTNDLFPPAVAGQRAVLGNGRSNIVEGYGSGLPQRLFSLSKSVCRRPKSGRGGRKVFLR